MVHIIVLSESLITNTLVSGLAPLQTCMVHVIVLSESLITNTLVSGIAPLQTCMVHIIVLSESLITNTLVSLRLRSEMIQTHKIPTLSTVHVHVLGSVCRHKCYRDVSARGPRTSGPLHLIRGGSKISSRRVQRPQHYVFTDRVRSTREGYVLTCVCTSVCP